MFWAGRLQRRLAPFSPPMKVLGNSPPQRFTFSYSITRGLSVSALPIAAMAAACASPCCLIL